MITLTTDFGLQDPYVSEMKAVIFKICSNAKIVDITHNVSKFDIRMGAFILAAASTYFPENTIHVAVIDPGVGTKRRALLIETSKNYFIGPDNGLLVLAAEKQGINQIYELKNSNLMEIQVSNTFHGRDIFAPAAAHLQNGVNPNLFGSKIKELRKPDFTQVFKSSKSLIGEVLYIDSFGNIITNICIDDFIQNPFGRNLTIKTANSKYTLKFCKSYSEAKKGDLLILFGSHSFLEISANQNNAADLTMIKIGDKIAILNP
ncbi:MAG: hypothetical protein AC479_05265 [miscellaneous Crenarchaeota group-6 archaeon AD8-1]|nr:MAG: hypothetical protein AC479_05265 [miscellaneous Crenarchaeota group-6 archaeon AD8-1]